MAEQMWPLCLRNYQLNVNRRSSLGVELKADTRCCENIEGSSFSPRCFLRSQLGERSRSTDVFHNFKRKVIEKRVRNLRASWRHCIPRAPSNAAGVFCMDVDPSEERYLLCGACNGLVSIVDLESPIPSDSSKPVIHSVVCSDNRSGHRFLVTRCQWYPQDSSTFVTSSMDRTVKLWDANNMKVVDEYPFSEPVVQLHWSAAPSPKPLIAVANMTSNIELVDPRAGESVQNLRWKIELVTSVQWSPEESNFLLSGGKNGNVALWDVRSAKSCLKTLCAPLENAHNSCVGGMRFSKDGLYLVTMSIDNVARLWRTHDMQLVNTVKLPTVTLPAPTANPSIHFEVFAWDGVQRLCVPCGEEILITNLEQCPNPYSYYLVGHFCSVTACVSRESLHQVISSSNDRMVLVWSPDMDEGLPDVLSNVVKRLREDEWSDDD